MTESRKLSQFDIAFTANTTAESLPEALGLALAQIHDGSAHLTVEKDGRFYVEGVLSAVVRERRR